MSNYDKYPAKQTKYNGIWFKSNLEARTAEALDRIGADWMYEPRCFRGDNYSGGQYTPDFWLPNDDMYIEVVGKIDDHHVRNAIAFCNNENVIDTGTPERHIASSDSPMFAFVTSGGHMHVMRHDGTVCDEVGFMVCSKCGKAYAINIEGPWACPHCGDYGRSRRGVGNLFEYASYHRDDMPPTNAINVCASVHGDCGDDVSVEVPHSHARRDARTMKHISVLLEEIDTVKLDDIKREVAQTYPPHVGLLMGSVGVIDDGNLFTILFTRSQDYFDRALNRNLGPVKNAVKKLYGERQVRCAICTLKQSGTEER